MWQLNYVRSTQYTISMIELYETWAEIAIWQITPDIKRSHYSMVTDV